MKSIFKIIKFILIGFGAIFLAGLVSLLFIDPYDDEVEVIEEESSPELKEEQIVSKPKPVSNINFGSVDKHVFRTGNNRGNTVYVVAVDGINDSNILNNAEKADLKVYGRKRPYTDADFVVHVFFYDSPDIPNLNEFSDSNTGEVLSYITLEHSKKPFAEWRRYVMTGNTELIVD